MNTATLEEWRRVWRDGVAPCLTIEHLEALAVALETDDPRLTQGSTTTPPPLMCVADWPAEAASALGFCGAVDHGGFGRASVGQCEETFARLCYACDERTGKAADVRWFLNFFDDTPRDKMRCELLSEVQRALASRRAQAA